MCQCRRSWRKSWRLLLVRSSATLGQASGDSTGGHANVGKQIVDGPVPQIQEKIIEVIKVILREQCQRMCLFTFERRVVVQQLLTGVLEETRGEAELGRTVHKGLVRLGGHARGTPRDLAAGEAASLVAPRHAALR